MFEKHSIKKQFIYSLISVILLSLVSSFLVSASVSIIVWGKGVFKENNDLLAYFNKEVSQLERYIDEKRETLLDESSKSKLEKILNPDKIKYEVISLENGKMYGNSHEEVYLDKKNLMKNINKKNISEHNTNQYLPIIDKKDNLVGSIYLSYDLGSVEISNSMHNNIVILLTSYLSPFLFIILYTILFSKVFSKNINKPLEKLINSSEKIQNNDLDFSLEYIYDNEIGKLTSSFEKMRINLKETLNKQWKVEKEKREIIQALSHDLRTPLTVVKGHVELLQSGAYKKEDRLKRYLNTIEKSTNRAVLLVEDLNVLSKIDDVDFRLHKVKIYLKEFITEKFEEYRTLVLDKKINFNVELINIENDTFIYIDKSQISRVIDNIITNSFRYMSENGNLNVKISNINNNVIFKIKDDGCGFIEKDLDKVFDRFYKGDKSRTKGEGNSGLGLYISKQIIDKHNGHIKAYNEDGAVIEFMLNLEEKDE